VDCPFDQLGDESVSCQVFMTKSIERQRGRPSMGGLLSTQGPESSRQTQLELVQHRRDSLEPLSKDRLHQMWSKHSSPGGNAADYDVLSELFAAALDADDVELAKKIFETVARKFPPVESTRTMLMQGNLDEAKGDRKSAQERYKSILKTDEANVKAWKRSIALLVDTKRTEAIDMLVKYLDTFSDDQEGWLELTGLYLDERCYNQAVFCMEELIMLDSTNQLYQIRLGDILYTRGDFEQALKFYCRSLELSPHVRALYGIQQSCRRLLASEQKDTRLEFQWRDLLEMSKSMLDKRLGSNASSDVAKAWLHEKVAA
jgi:tetratricopeptide (TPR) repeat protein